MNFIENIKKYEGEIVGVYVSMDLGMGMGLKGELAVHDDFITLSYKGSITAVKYENIVTFHPCIEDLVEDEEEEEDSYLDEIMRMWDIEFDEEG